MQKVLKESHWRSQIGHKKHKKCFSHIRNTVEENLGKENKGNNDLNFANALSGLRFNGVFFNEPLIGPNLVDASSFSFAKERLSSTPIILQAFL